MTEGMSVCANLSKMRRIEDEPEDKRRNKVDCKPAMEENVD